LRTPGEFPGHAPPLVAGRHIGVHVADAREFLMHGALGMADELPGRLFACMEILWSQEAERDAVAAEDARRNRESGAV